MTTSSNSRKFAVDTILIALSQAITGLFSLITLPALTKSYNAEIYGLWCQIIVTNNLLGTFINLQLNTAVVRYLAAEENKNKIRQALGAMFWIIIFVSFLILLLGYLFKRNISFFLFSDYGYTSFVVLSFFWSATTAIFNFLISYFRSKNKMKLLTTIQIICSGIKVIFVFFLSFSKYKIESLIASQFLVEAFFITLLLIIIIRDIGVLPINFKNIKKYLSLSMPHILNVDLLWIINSSDRYFITYFLNLTMTGIYSASSSLGTIIALFYSPIAFVLFPVLSKFWEEGHIKKINNYLSYSIKIFLTLAIPSTFGLCILSPYILKLMATQQFVIDNKIVFLLALGTLFLGIYNINLYVIFLIQKTKWIPVIIGLSAAISIILNVTLIPRMDLLGAAISKVGSFLFLAVIATVIAKKIFGYKFDYLYAFKSIIATFAMSLFLMCIKADSLLKIVAVIIIGIVIYFMTLLILRAFSKEDRNLLTSLIPFNNKKIEPN